MVLHFIDLSAEDKTHLGEIVTSLPTVEMLRSPGDSAVVPTGILSNNESDRSK
jgi:hypothetical protein